MPATLQSAQGTRCARCATLIRNNRQRCPSCDLDFAVSTEQPRSASRIAAAVSNDSKKSSGDSNRLKARAAKANARLCPVCMSSVNESEMSESGGQMVCNPCAVTLKAKATKAAAAKAAEPKDKDAK